MINKIPLHEGEILRILVRRAGFRVDDIAPQLGLIPNSLSRAFKSSKISKKVKRKAVEVLGVDESIFETGLGYEIPESREDVVGDDGEEYRALAMENERLKEENARLAADLLRERDLSEDLRRALLLIAGKEAG